MARLRSGPHLHFEVRTRVASVDPQPALSFWGAGAGAATRGAPAPSHPRYASSAQMSRAFPLYSNAWNANVTGSTRTCVLPRM